MNASTGRGMEPRESVSALQPGTLRRLHSWASEPRLLPMSLNISKEKRPSTSAGSGATEALFGLEPATTPSLHPPPPTRTDATTDQFPGFIMPNFAMPKLRKQSRRHGRRSSSFDCNLQHG